MTVGELAEATRRGKGGRVLRGGALAVLMALIAGGSSAPALADEPIEENATGAVHVVAGLDGETWRVDTSTRTNSYVDSPTQVRVPSERVQAIPDGEEYAWLGAAGTPRWSVNFPTSLAQLKLSTGTLRAQHLASTAPEVNVSLSNVAVPGGFALYEQGAQSVPSGHIDPVGELFR